MCAASIWCKTVEIYMELDEEESREDIGDERREERRDGGRNETQAPPTSDYVLYDQEACVEEVVATFVDEEENEDYKKTPPTSDCEDGEGRVHYDNWKRGSGELKIRQVFQSVADFKQAVLEYALKGGWNLQFTRWVAKKCEAKCGVESGDKCEWIIYCSYEESVSQWMVKSFQENHTCYKDGRCKILTETVICDMYINELRNDPLLRPKVMQERIHERYNVAPSFDQCRKAKKRALQLIEDEFTEQYARMKDYRDELLE